MAVEIRISERVVEKQIAKLNVKGVIARVGPDRGRLMEIKCISPC